MTKEEFLSLKRGDIVKSSSMKRRVSGGYARTIPHKSWKRGVAVLATGYAMSWQHKISKDSENGPLTLATWWGRLYHVHPEEWTLDVEETKKAVKKRDRERVLKVEREKRRRVKNLLYRAQQCLADTKHSLEEVVDYGNHMNRNLDALPIQDKFKFLASRSIEEKRLLEIASLSYEQLLELVADD